MHTWAHALERGQRNGCSCLCQPCACADVGLRTPLSGADPLACGCPLCLFLTLAPPPPAHTSVAHIITPFHQGKKYRLASLISACHLMRSLLFIFSFVRRRGNTSVRPRPPAILLGAGSSLLGCRGLPGWYVSGDQEVQAATALKGLLGDTNKNNMQMSPPATGRRNQMLSDEFSVSHCRLSLPPIRKPSSAPDVV